MRGGVSASKPQVVGIIGGGAGRGNCTAAEWLVIGGRGGIWASEPQLVDGGREKLGLEVGGAVRGGPQLVDGERGRAGEQVMGIMGRRGRAHAHRSRSKWAGGELGALAAFTLAALLTWPHAHPSVAADPRVPAAVREAVGHVQVDARSSHGIEVAGPTLQTRSATRTLRECLVPSLYRYKAAKNLVKALALVLVARRCYM